MNSKQEKYLNVMQTWGLVNNVIVQRKSPSYVCPSMYKNDKNVIAVQVAERFHRKDPIQHIIKLLFMILRAPFAYSWSISEFHNETQKLVKQFCEDTKMHDRVVMARFGMFIDVGINEQLFVGAGYTPQDLSPFMLQQMLHNLWIFSCHFFVHRAGKLNDFMIKVVVCSICLCVQFVTWLCVQFVTDRVLQEGAMKMDETHTIWQDILNGNRFGDKKMAKLFATYLHPKRRQKLENGMVVLNYKQMLGPPLASICRQQNVLSGACKDLAAGRCFVTHLQVKELNFVYLVSRMLDVCVVKVRFVFFFFFFFFFFFLHANGDGCRIVSECLVASNQAHKLKQLKVFDVVFNLRILSAFTHLSSVWIETNNRYEEIHRDAMPASTQSEVRWNK